MKNLILLSLLIIVTISNSYAQLKYTVKGEILNIENKGGLKDGDTVTLQYSSSKKSFFSVVKDNKFTFHETVSEPTVAMLNLKYTGVKLLLDSSDYFVKLTAVQVAPHQFKYDNTIETNSTFHNTWENFYSSYGKLYDKKENLLNKIDSGNYDERKVSELKQQVSKVDSEIVRSYKILALEHPDNFAVAYILPGAPDFSYDNYINIYATLTDKVRSSDLGKELRDKLNAVKSLQTIELPYGKLNGNNVLGSKLPRVNCVDFNGRKVDIGGKISKSKYTLIEFWASWCNPCRTINTDLRAKQDEYKKAGLDFIGFSLDNDLNNWKKAIKADHLGWLQVSDLKAQNSPLVNYFKIYSIPSNLLVDRTGTILAKDIYGEQLADFLLKNKGLQVN